MSRHKRVAPGRANTERAGLWPLWLCWVVFVVYGSLVPLDFRPLPLELAWQQLMNAPMLKLGIESRADWVANGVLYTPVGFLSAGMLMGRRPGAARCLWAAMLGLGFGVLLAVAVELAQTAFPPRTVSRNDMLAESLGSVLGVLLATVGGGRFRELLASFGHGGGALAQRLAPFYAVLYLALAMFPYDLLVSADEWRSKLNSDMVGLVLAGSALSGGTVRLLGKLAVETLAVLPLGALWAAGRGNPSTQRPGAPGKPPGRLYPALLGALLGLLIECAQLTIASGQSQGVSVLTRAIGFALGALAWDHRAAWQPESLRAWLRKFTQPLLAALVPLLVLYGGAWRGPWLAPADALRRLQYDVYFVPFYYHYYTTEMHAVVSLVAVSLSYAPLGLLGWAWHVRGGVVATMALLLSAAMEAAKLPSTNSHPDPSNLWIAAAAAWAAQALMHRLTSRPARAPNGGSTQPASPRRT